MPTVIYSRLIAKYKKPIIIPTHNFPVLDGTDDFVQAECAIGIGGHESKANFLTNYGFKVEHDDNLLVTGGYGPMGDGSFGPAVISPSNILSTNRGWEDNAAGYFAGSLPSAAGLSHRRRNVDCNAGGDRCRRAAHQRRQAERREVRRLPNQECDHDGSALRAAHPGVQAGQRRDQRRRRVGDSQGDGRRPHTR